jgi:hypothetical protein
MKNGYYSKCRIVAVPDIGDRPVTDIGGHPVTNIGYFLVADISVYIMWRPNPKVKIWTDWDKCVTDHILCKG